MHRFVTAGALVCALVSSAAADDAQTKTAEAKPAAKSTKAAPAASGPQAVVLETTQGTIVISSPRRTRRRPPPISRSWCVRSSTTALTFTA